MYVYASVSVSARAWYEEKDGTIDVTAMGKVA